MSRPFTSPYAAFLRCGKQLRSVDSPTVKVGAVQTNVEWIYSCMLVQAASPAPIHHKSTATSLTVFASTVVWGYFGPN